MIAIAAPFLQKLHVSQIDVNGEWLIANLMKNLRELLIHRARFISFERLKTFLSSQSKLEAFHYSGRHDITKIGDTLTKYCPNLKTFEDSYTWFDISNSTSDRYNFLSNFSNLSSVTLTSCTFCGSDLYKTLLMLAEKAIVKLKVFWNMTNLLPFNKEERARIMKHSFDHFTSLQTVEIQTVHNGYYKGLDYLQCDFFLNFVSQLKNLITLKIHPYGKIHVSKIIDLVPRTQILSISNINFYRLPFAMRKIVCALRALRTNKAPNGKKLIHLIVSSEQWRELQVYEDVKEIMKISIDTSVKPHNAFS